MILKSNNTNKTFNSQFDLLGRDEAALSKGFAFMLSYDRDFYYKFLKFLGIPTKNTENNYFNTSVEIEKHRNEGRTDIELMQQNKYHVIIECKIKQGKAKRQRTQYLSAFNDDAVKKILCFLTQEKDSKKEIPEDVTVKNANWLEIIELYNSRHFTNKPIVSEFLKFVTKNYKMRELKEILVQDLSDIIEITRFEKYGVYRRDQTYGAPIYFSPYFTRNSGRQVGITNLSKILGILSFKPKDIENVSSDFVSFSTDQTQIKNWINGVKHGKDKKNSVYTYYFLDTPFTFQKSLLKDGGIKVGRGKNWIAAKIPQNRCVTFKEFLKHMP